MSSTSTGIVVRPVRPAELEEVGHLVAEAFIVDGHTERGGRYESVIRDTADRAARAELLVAVDEETGAVLGSVTFAPPGSAYADLAVDDEGEFRMLAVSPVPAAAGRPAAGPRGPRPRPGAGAVADRDEHPQEHGLRPPDLRPRGLRAHPGPGLVARPGVELMTYARELTD
ncbi:hypothetical protein ACFQZC_14475 [Streptacidiphilus monticola]